MSEERIKELETKLKEAKEEVVKLKATKLMDGSGTIASYMSVCEQLKKSQEEIEDRKETEQSLTRELNKVSEECEFLESHNRQLVKSMKRLKLEFDANVCECGERWDETDASILVEESLSTPPTKAMLDRIEAEKKLLRDIKSMCGHPDADQACRNIIKAIENL